MGEDARDAAVKGEDSSVLSRRTAREVNSLRVFFEEISGFILQKVFCSGWLVKNRFFVAAIGLSRREESHPKRAQKGTLFCSRKELKRAHFLLTLSGRINDGYRVHP